MVINYMCYLQTSANLRQYYATCFSLISGIILFGGLLAPSVRFICLYYFAFSGGLLFGFPNIINYKYNITYFYVFKRV